jgi:glycosyltransferase involved in cell wall biosynthesis
MEPSISVVMPVYNAQAFLSEAIQSILDQTFTDFECIILNDGSTDRSLEIIQSFKDPRIRAVDNDQNIKIVRTLNKGISLAKGKYIVRMDADDICLPERFKTQFNFMEENPEVGACGSWFENIGDRSGISQYETDHNMIRFKMLYQMPVLHPSTIIRKSVLEKYNITYNTDFPGSEDLDFFIRIAEVSKVVNIPKVLLQYRQHTASAKSLLQDSIKNLLFMTTSYQFGKIGIEISEKDTELFTRFCYADFELDSNERDLIEKFLVKTIVANSKSNYLDHAFLVKTIGEKWFHLCYNASGTLRGDMYKQYLLSPLRKYYNPGRIALMKLFLKSLKN